MEVRISKAEVTMHLVLHLNESEVRALDALVGYGVDPFLKVFYKEMGQAYMKPHEAGLRSLFASVAQVAPFLKRADDAREAFKKPYQSTLHSASPTCPPTQSKEAS